MEDLADGMLVIVAGKAREGVVLNGLFHFEPLIADGALVFVNGHKGVVVSEPVWGLWDKVLDTRYRRRR